MRTTIDSAGRIVVPKSVREAMRLEAGRAVDIAFVDGRIEIEIVPTDVTVEIGDGLPVITPVGEMPAVTDEEIRTALEATRR